MCRHDLAPRERFPVKTLDVIGFPADEKKKDGRDAHVVHMAGVGNAVLVVVQRLASAAAVDPGCSRVNAL